MKKSAYFASQWYDDAWPDSKDLERYFKSTRDGRLPDTRGNYAATLSAKGIGGTAHLDEQDGRIDLTLYMWSVPGLGAMFVYAEHRAGTIQAHVSIGDPARTGETVSTQEGDELPASLFVSFDKAWQALIEFTETDGQLPRGIDWVADSDLPSNTFPPAMTEAEEDAWAAAWETLYEELSVTLAMFGTEDSTEGDFWIVDEGNGRTQHKVYFNKLFMLEPRIVKAVQALLTEFPDWEVFVVVSIDEYEGQGWPEMGLIIRTHEIVDGLQRQYFPAEYRNIHYEGSRVGTDRD